MIDFKLLGTGTRSEYLDPLLVVRLLDQATRYGPGRDALPRYQSFTLYIGDCPTGFDAIARGWWIEVFGKDAIRTSPAPMVERWVSPHGHRLFVFYADWYPWAHRYDMTLDLTAGPRRNKRMVRFAKSEGCERYIAVTKKFIPCPGTINCRTLALFAGMYGDTHEG